MARYKLIILSDSHGDRQIVADIKKRYEGKVDAIFHNGDSELPASDSVWLDMKVVRGNCDIDSAYPDTLVTRFDNLTIAQTHGHLFNINFGWQRLDLFAQENQADICLYGHLHRAAAWQLGKTVFINPGSVTQPRGDVMERLYAKVEVDDERILVEFFTRDHELYAALSQEFIR